MRGKKLSLGLRVALTIFTVTLFAASAATATEKKLHNFGNGTDGADLRASLIFDAAGNLYGTSYLGGSHGEGTAFEMSPSGSGGWTEKRLHNFGAGTDGTRPLGGVVMDTAGNLYGTTLDGGTHNNGTVFELSPNGSGG